MILKFGKHKGKDLADTDVPLSYLQWLEEFANIPADLRKELNHEIDRRTGDRPGAGIAR